MVKMFLLLPILLVAIAVEGSIFPRRSGSWFGSPGPFNPDVPPYLKQVDKKKTAVDADGLEADLKRARGRNQAHLTFSFKGGTIDETIIANPDTFVATYQVKTGKGEAMLVDDYNTYLRVIRTPNVDRCVIAPIAELMQDFDSGEAFAEWITNTSRAMTDVTINYYMRDDTSALKDTRCLNEEATEVCKGLPVFWVNMETKVYGNRDNTIPKQLHGSIGGSYGLGNGRGSIGGSYDFGSGRSNIGVRYNSGNGRGSIGGSYDFGSGRTNIDGRYNFGGGRGSISGNMGLGRNGGFSAGVGLRLKF